MDNIRADLFKQLKRIVVKVGTRVLVNPDGSFNKKAVRKMVKGICQLKATGHQVVLVSSGAVGLGMEALGFKTRPQKVADEQACAAVGQIQLMHIYSEIFGKHKEHVAQILLSHEDFQIRKRYHNLQATINSLLDKGAIPIINENDSITTDELKVGDNDKLSSDVAHFLEANLLVLLTDIDGLYPKNPKKYPDAEPFSIVPKITKEILAMGRGAGSSNSIGGMRSKLKAIEQAVKGGVPVVLANGRKADLKGMVSGKKIGTLFLPDSKKLKQRQKWIAFVSKAKGRLVLDDGGIKALQSGKSLLPAGIRYVSGHFSQGDFVEICSQNKEVKGRGKVDYSYTELKKISGMKSSEAKKNIRRQAPEEIIHRNNLVMY